MIIHAPGILGLLVESIIWDRDFSYIVNKARVLNETENAHSSQ
jgi:hypothetical protein